MTDEITEITINDVIKYQLLHPSYGRAEFEVCPVFKHGKMTELFIYRRQQDTSDIYRLVIPQAMKIDRFHIESLNNEQPHTWMEMWCKLHKTITHKVYAPNGTSQISFGFHCGDTITIRFEDTNGPK